MNLPNKFQCHYKLTLQWTAENGDIQHSIVTDPLTIEFNVTKQLFQSTNTATIVCYNLDGFTREGIYQDKYLFNTEKTKMLTLEAGYGENLTCICVGYIQQCYSERKGTDFVTTIEVLDPDILNQYTSVTFAAGTTFEEAYKYLASQMPNLEMGELGNLNGVFQTPATFNGNAFVAINELTGGHTFVDNKVLNTLNDNETLKGYGAYVIDSEAGLLETPKRHDAVLEINMIFEPNLRLGQLVDIKSSTQPRFDGQYKIVGISHNCTISGARCGSRTTSIQVLYLDWLTNSNVNLTGNPQGQKPSTVVNNKVEPINTRVSGEINKVYSEIRKNNGNIPNIRINKIATWKDLLKHDNSSNEILSDLTTGYMANAQAVANRLLEFCNKYYPNNKVTINSAWRTRLNNARCGGVANSQHLKGRAIDFSISGVNPATVYRQAKASGMFTWVGQYSSFTHVDVRG